MIRWLVKNHGWLKIIAICFPIAGIIILEGEWAFWAFTQTSMRHRSGNVAGFIITNAVVFIVIGVVAFVVASENHLWGKETNGS